MAHRHAPRRPIPVLVNASAGARGAHAADAVRRGFREAGVAVDVAVVEAGGIAKRVREVVGEGAATVAVAGGDGTMRAAASELADGTTALLPVPTGSLNSFARGVGIHGIRGAARAMMHGTVERVTVGTAEDRLFLNTATVGAYARLVRLRELLRRPLGRELATLAAAWRVLREVPEFDATVAAADETLRGRFRLVWAGVGRGPLGLPGGLAARRAAAELEVALFPAQGAAGGLLDEGARRGARAWPLLQRRWAVFTIEAPHRLDLTLDGEPIALDPPVRLAVRPAGLAVVCLPVRRGTRRTPTRGSS